MLLCHVRFHTDVNYTVEHRGALGRRGSQLALVTQASPFLPIDMRIYRRRLARTLANLVMATVLWQAISAHSLREAASPGLDAYIHGVEQSYRCETPAAEHLDDAVGVNQMILALPGGTTMALCLAICRENERTQGCRSVSVEFEPGLAVDCVHALRHMHTVVTKCSLWRDDAPSPLPAAQRASTLVWHRRVVPLAVPRSAAVVRRDVIVAIIARPEGKDLGVDRFVSMIDHTSWPRNAEAVVFACGTKHGVQLTSALIETFGFSASNGSSTALLLPNHLALRVAGGAVLQSVDNRTIVAVDVLQPSSLGTCAEESWRALAVLHRLMEIYRGPWPHTAFPPNFYALVHARHSVFGRIPTVVSSLRFSDPRRAVLQGRRAVSATFCPSIPSVCAMNHSSTHVPKLSYVGWEDGITLTRQSAEAIDRAARLPLAFYRCQDIADAAERLGCAAWHAIDMTVNDGIIGIAPTT
jgi:hypothetical protein